MSQSYALPEWVTPRLNAIESHLHVHGEEIAELRGTGVAESRVSVLYPFEPEMYYAGVQRLFESAAAQSELTLLFAFAGVYRTVGTQLPQPQRQLCNALREYRQYAPPEIQHLTSRKLLFENVLQLPLVLRLLREYYPFRADADWGIPRSPEVLDASLTLLVDVSGEFVEYLANHMPAPTSE